ILPVRGQRTRPDQIQVLRALHRPLSRRGDRVQPGPGPARLRSDEEETTARLDEAAKIRLGAMAQRVGRGVQEDEAAVASETVFRDDRRIAAHPQLHVVPTRLLREHRYHLASPRIRGPENENPWLGS